MWLSFVRKQVGLKVALIATAVMVFIVSLVTLVLGKMRFGLVSEENFFKIFILFALAVIVFEFILVMLCVNIFVNRPLGRLQQTIQRVSDGNLGTRCELDTDDEFSELGENFNRMIQSLGELSDTRKRMEQKLIKAEESLKYKTALEDKARIIERMNTELSAAFTDLTLMFTVSQALNSVLEVNELTSVVQKVFSDQYKLDVFALYLFQPETGFLRLSTQKGIFQDRFQIKDDMNSRVNETREQSEVRGDAPVRYATGGGRREHPLNDIQEISLGVGIGIAGKTADLKQAQYFSNVALQSTVELSQHERVLKGSVFSLPLRVHDTLIGVLTLCRFAEDAFSVTDRQSLESIASQMAIAYDRAKLYTKTRELSVRDELTGIYNRRHFLHMIGLELKRSERFKRPVSVLMIDVDYFKDYNDTHGHLKGDHLLKQLTKLVGKNIREVDLFARFGGEEFIVMLPDTGPHEAVRAAGKLRELVRAHFEKEVVRTASDDKGELVGLTISIGVSSYPAYADNRESLINTADMALYMAKKKGRDRVFCYQSDTLPLEEMADKLKFVH